MNNATNHYFLFAPLTSLLIAISASRFKDTYIDGTTANNVAPILFAQKPVWHLQYVQTCQYSKSMVHPRTLFTGEYIHCLFVIF